MLTLKEVVKQLAVTKKMICLKNSYEKIRILFQEMQTIKNTGW
jgi:hypothetical protein